MVSGQNNSRPVIHTNGAFPVFKAINDWCPFSYLSTISKILWFQFYMTIFAFHLAIICKQIDLLYYRFIVIIIIITQSKTTFKLLGMLFNMSSSSRFLTVIVILVKYVHSYD